MPSSEYYRRQADTLLAMALASNEPGVSALCRTLALQYTFLAKEKNADGAPVRSGIAAPPAGAAEPIEQAATLRGRRA